MIHAVVIAVTDCLHVNLCCSITRATLPQWRPLNSQLHGVRWSDYSGKTHMGIVEGVCNSTHGHGFLCAPLKGILFILKWTARANRTSCVCVVHHLLKALKGNQISLFRAVSAERPRCGSFTPITSLRRNLISLVRQSQRKGPPQFDVSTPLYRQYFDRFHDSIIICRDPCQGFNCYMRNYTFSCGDARTKHWLCY